MKRTNSKQVFLRASVGVVCLLFLAISSLAQTPVSGSRQAEPSKPIRQFVVLHAQSLSDVEKKLHPDDKTEELIGGEGMQLRVAVQHERNKPAGQAEVHDASDDVYYVLEGSAALTLGGTLDAPREVEPGEWRGARILGGQTLEVMKGDLIIVPRGTPHVRSTAAKDFSMILIKIFAQPRPADPKPSSPSKKPLGFLNTWR